MNQINRVYKIPYHTAFVVNPTAGNGRARRIWFKIESLLEKRGQHYRVYFTRKTGEGTDLAALAVSDEAELVVAVGGDGTLREVINGINLEKNILGIIPAGTGNGFIRSCGIPLNWYRALQGLASWYPRRVDLGLVNGVYFLNVVGIGFDAAVAKTAAKKNSYLKGYPAYAAAVLSQIISFKRFSCKIRCNGLCYEDDQTLLAVAANGSYYGGRLCIVPRANIDDGLLDLCLVKKRSISNLIDLGLKVIFRRHLDSSDVVKFAGSDIYMKAVQKVPVHIDGDLFDLPEVNITTKPGILRVLAPAKQMIR